MRLFTKSAFKQALICPTSLYYYYDREHYANQMNEDDFLQALADGGNQVGDLAKVYYDVHADADINVLDYDKSQEITARLFRRDEVNIAEAAFRWKNCFIRADIIEKKGNHIHLIEVKAKSWNENEDSFVGAWDKNRVDSKILEYVYDVAFQKYIIQKALGPGFAVKASLMMADKTVKAEADGINQYFRVVKDGLADVSADDIRPKKPKIGLATGNEEILAPFKDNLHDSVYLDIPGLLAEMKALKEALLRYCELDTMSMVFIWEYFHEMTGA